MQTKQIKPLKCPFCGGKGRLDIYRQPSRPYRIATVVIRCKAKRCLVKPVLAIGSHLKPLQLINKEQEMNIIKKAILKWNKRV